MRKRTKTDDAPLWAKPRPKNNSLGGGKQAQRTPGKAQRTPGKAQRTPGKAQRIAESRFSILSHGILFEQKCGAAQDSLRAKAQRGQAKRSAAKVLGYVKRKLLGDARS
jgi:hypothetical protein